MTPAPCEYALLVLDKNNLRLCVERGYHGQFVNIKYTFVERS